MRLSVLEPFAHEHVLSAQPTLETDDDMATDTTANDAKASRDARRGPTRFGSLENG